MKIENDFVELIYTLAIGSYNTEDYPIKESQYVINEFDEERVCGKAYKEIFDANIRLCNRLHPQEEDDDDTEIMISSFFDILKIMSIKMFNYGVFFSQRQDDENINELIYFYQALNDKTQKEFIQLLRSLNIALK